MPAQIGDPCRIAAARRLSDDRNEIIHYGGLFVSSSYEAQRGFRRIRPCADVSDRSEACQPCPGKRTARFRPCHGAARRIRPARHCAARATRRFALRCRAAAAARRGRSAQRRYRSAPSAPRRSRGAGWRWPAWTWRPPRARCGWLSNWPAREPLVWLTLQVNGHPLELRLWRRVLHAHLGSRRGVAARRGLTPWTAAHGEAAGSRIRV